MKKDLKISDCNFDFTGSNHTEKTAIENGFKQLTGKELKDRIINRTVNGDYLMGYTFVARIYENGTTDGINNVGSRDFGKLTIFRFPYERTCSKSIA